MKLTSYRMLTNLNCGVEFWAMDRRIVVTQGYGHERFASKVWDEGCVPRWVGGSLIKAKFEVRNSPYGLLIPRLFGLDENWMYDKSPIEGLIKECVKYAVVRVGVISVGRDVDE